MFADDCLDKKLYFISYILKFNLYRTINSVADERQLQQDLDTMIEWSNASLMKFNVVRY